MTEETQNAEQEQAVEPTPMFENKSEATTVRVWLQSTSLPDISWAYEKSVDSYETAVLYAEAQKEVLQHLVAEDVTIGASIIRVTQLH